MAITIKNTKPAAPKKMTSKAKPGTTNNPVVKNSKKC